MMDVLRPEPSRPQRWRKLGTESQCGQRRIQLWLAGQKEGFGALPDQVEGLTADVTGVCKEQAVVTPMSSLAQISMIFRRTMKTEFCIRQDHFYSYLDEKHFFTWLESIDGIRDVKSTTAGLAVRLTGIGLDRDGVYDLIGLLARYGLAMGFVRDLIRPEDEAWFDDSTKYWHSRVFGAEGRLERGGADDGSTSSTDH
jgi:hypothetical protein